MTAIRVDRLAKQFPDGTVAIDGVSFEVGAGEVVSLLGPSGCGKTTTLRCIAGLEVPDDGEVRVGDEIVVSPQVFRVPEKRGLSMVFQQYALWPHLTVEENVAFGPRVRRLPRDQIGKMVGEALGTVRLERERHRRISQLSGGQQQRVALARAIVFRPDVILFDEPLSNLDAKLREEMRLELVELQREYAFAALYVTHDQLEAISLSDRVIIMNRGRIKQVGSPHEIWEQPATKFVADFIGEVNKLDAVTASGGEVRIAGNLLLSSTQPPSLPPDTPVEVYVPYAAVELEASTSQRPNTARGRIGLVNFQGHSTLVKVRTESGDVIARVTNARRFREGDEVGVHFPAEAVRCFPRDDAESSLPVPRALASP